MLEAMGFAASILVAASLMMSNIWRLRWLNLIGALAFTAYGIMVGAWPVAAVNGFVAVIDCYYIWQLYSKKDFFSLLEVPADDKAFLKNFLALYGADIEKFFPGFALKSIKNPKCIFILRNLMPVGLFVYEEEEEGSARIWLDYVSEAYRDLSNTRFLFNTHCVEFIQAGIKEFVMRDPSPLHKQYLLKMGFTPSVISPTTYIKPLACGKDYTKHSAA